MSEVNLAAIQRIIRSTSSQPTPTSASISHNWSRFCLATVLQATAGAKMEKKTTEVQPIIADPALIKEDSDEEPVAEEEATNPNPDPAVPAEGDVELQELLFDDLSPQVVTS
jgi:hypothetical protein